MLGTEFIQSEIARLAWLDAGSEGLNGMLGVAFTLRNRQRAGWWNGDWIKLLSNHRMYLSHNRPYTEELPDPRVFSFQGLLQEIDGIFRGSTPDTVTVSAQSVLSKPAPPTLYYARLDQIEREDFLTNISRNPAHPRVAQIGLLYFFA